MTLFTTIVLNLNNQDYQNKIYNILNHKDVTKKQKVQFALHCAKDLDQYYDTKKYKEVYNIRQKCLDLLDRWLIGEKSVTNKQLTDAASASYAATAGKREEIQKQNFNYLLQMLDMDYKIFRLMA